MSDRSPRLPEPGAEVEFTGRVGPERGGRRSTTALWIVGALALVGVAIAGRQLSPGPVPSGSPSPVAVATTAPPASQPDCDPVDPASPVPRLRLGADADAIGVRGLLGTTRRAGKEEPGRGWQVPGPEVALRIVTGSPLRLILGTGDCLRSIDIEAAPADLAHVPGEGERQSVVTLRLDPPRHVLWLDPLADGDWVLRVVAHYWTGPEPGPEQEVWSEQYFRVRAGIDPAPTASPVALVTPNVPCAFFVGQGGIGARLVAGGAAPVFGTPTTGSAQALDVASGASATILLDGDGCAIAWSIELIDPASGEVVETIESVGNIAEDPALTSQNRWSVGPLPPGRWLLHARYHTAKGGPWLDAWWLVQVAPFSPPAAWIGRPGTDQRLALLPGCGLSWSFPDGTGGADGCGSVALPVGLDVLMALSIEDLIVELPGWTITRWSVACGEVVTVDGREEFVVPESCYVGSSLAPTEVRFRLPPGEFALLVELGAARDGIEFSVPYYGYVLVRGPAGG